MEYDADVRSLARHLLAEEFKATLIAFADQAAAYHKAQIDAYMAKECRKMLYG